MQHPYTMLFMRNVLIHFIFTCSIPWHFSLKVVSLYISPLQKSQRRDTRLGYFFFFRNRIPNPFSLHVASLNNVLYKERPILYISSLQVAFLRISFYMQRPYIFLLYMQHFCVFLFIRSEFIYFFFFLQVASLHISLFKQPPYAFLFISSIITYFPLLVASLRITNKHPHTFLMLNSIPTHFSSQAAASFVARLWHPRHKTCPGAE